MRGRALSWELFPFSLREFLDFRGIGSEGALSTRRRLLIRKGFEEYWERGGFPEVAGVSNELRIRIHQEYFHTILYRDLVERHDVAHPRAVADLTHRLVDSVACLYTVNSLTGYLKALGHRVPKSAVSEYLEWFEDAYFLFTVRIFDASLARRNTNPKKIYCIDHALVASVSAQILINSGHLLENLVFVTLRRRHQEISYYKTRQRPGGGLHRAPAPRSAAAGAGVPVAGRSGNAQAGDRGAGRGDGGVGSVERNHRDPR